MKMKKRWKRIIGFLLVVSFLLPGEAGHFSLVTGKLARAMDTGKSITMEEYYNEGNYGIRVQADTSVTISSPEEFLMFRQCIKDGQTYWDGGENGFIGVQFCQTKDIHFADFKAEYSKSWKRMVLTKPDGEEIGSIDVDGKCYSASATTTAIAPEELGLSDALMLTGRKQDSEADTSFIEAFRGNYDGQGYTLSGLLLLTGLEAVLDEDGDKLQQGYCVEGIFGNDNRGCIYNLTLKNICAIEAENGILTRLNSGVIKDCRLENSTIWSRYDGRLG